MATWQPPSTQSRAKRPRGSATRGARLLRAAARGPSPAPAQRPLNPHHHGNLSDLPRATEAAAQGPPQVLGVVRMGSGAPLPKAFCCIYAQRWLMFSPELLAHVQLLIRCRKASRNQCCPQASHSASEPAVGAEAVQEGTRVTLVSRHLGSGHAVQRNPFGGSSHCFKGCVSLCQMR